jgi:hypothetical protein
MSDLVLYIISVGLRFLLPLIAPFCPKRSTSKTFLLVLLLLMSMRLRLIELSTSVLLMANLFDPTRSSSSCKTCLSSCLSSDISSYLVHACVTLSPIPFRFTTVYSFGFSDIFLGLSNIEFSFPCSSSLQVHA